MAIRGFTGLWGKQRGASNSPQGAQSSVWAPGWSWALGWSWNKGAQAGRRPPPHILCDGTGTQGVRREGMRAHHGQRELLREVKQGGDSQVCILEKYFDVSGEQARGRHTQPGTPCVCQLWPRPFTWGFRGEGEVGSSVQEEQNLILQRPGFLGSVHRRAHV